MVQINAMHFTKQRSYCTAEYSTVQYITVQARDGKSKTNNAIKPGGGVKTFALCQDNLGEILQTQPGWRAG